jgi:hypothetical protein
MESKKKEAAKSTSRADPHLRPAEEQLSRKIDFPMYAPR